MNSNRRHHSLDARYCPLDFDPSESTLGQSNLSDTETRTKITHVELLGCGMIGTVSCLTYGTWKGDPAALLVMQLTLRAKSDLFRFKSAELFIDFRPNSPNSAYPVIRSIWPRSNRRPAGNIRASPPPKDPGTTSKDVTLWSAQDYSISSSVWQDKSQSSWHQVTWNVSEPRGSKAGITDAIPLCVVVTCSDPFMAVVEAKAKVEGALVTWSLRNLPWSPDDPMRFDGMTPIGPSIADSDFSALHDEAVNQLLLQVVSSVSCSREPPKIPQTAVAQHPENLKATKHQQSSSSKVYRVQGIPTSFDQGIFVEAITSAMAISEDCVHVESFCTDPCEDACMAIVSFRASMGVIGGLQHSRRWTLNVPAEPWTLRDLDINIARPSGMVALYFDTDFLGFTNVGRPEELPESAGVDILAVHGLGGHAYASFKQRKGDYMWLADSLQSDLGRGGLSILLYGYEATVDNSTSFQSIEDLSLDLRLHLRDLRSRGPRKPIIFICHSLGGLLVKELVIGLAEENEANEDGSILSSTIGLLFFGVPNRGMETGALLSMIGGQPNLDLLESLSVDSQLLKVQARSFPIAFGPDRAVIYSFYETCVSNTAERVNGRLSMTGKPVILVDKNSATHSRPREIVGSQHKIPVQRAHADLVKFEKNSPDYRKVRSCIRNILEQNHL